VKDGRAVCFSLSATSRYAIMIYSNPATWVHPMFLHQREPLAPEERDARLGDSLPERRCLEARAQRLTGSTDG
jgi:hypothetical protein